MTTIRNMVADNSIASWTSFNNNIYEIDFVFRNFFYSKRIFDMMCFIGEVSYLKLNKTHICNISSIMNVWC